MHIIFCKIKCVCVYIYILEAFQFNWINADDVTVSEQGNIIGIAFRLFM